MIHVDLIWFYFFFQNESTVSENGETVGFPIMKSGWRTELEGIVRRDLLFT